ncbi:MAG TPA: hypothetical protein V6D33_12525 [Cyanophyceae cyanobacterium]
MRRANFETSSNLALRPSSAWTRPTRLGRIAGGIRRGISGFLKRPRIRNIVAKVGTTAGKAYGWTKRKVTGLTTGRKFMRYRGLGDRAEFARRRRRDRQRSRVRALNTAGIGSLLGTGAYYLATRKPGVSPTKLGLLTSAGAGALLGNAADYAVRRSRKEDRRRRRRR